MKTVFFTEAGSVYGFGHLMRCVSVAQLLQFYKHDITFYIRGDTDFPEIEDKFAVCCEEWLNIQNLEKILIDVDYSIVDSYYTDNDINNLIINNSLRVLFFDDYNRLQYPGGIVVNGIVGADRLDYNYSNDIIYLLGSNYQALKKEFWLEAKYSIRDSIRDFLITFGGSDPTNKTPYYIKKIIDSYEKPNIKVIIGKGFRNIDDIKSVCNESVSLVYNPSTSNIRNFMLEADLVIAAAGQTISELARLGVPTVGIQVVENQKSVLDYWSEIGFLIPEENIGLNLSRKYRSSCALKGKKVIDGQGCHRILEVFLSES